MYSIPPAPVLPAEPVPNVSVITDGLEASYHIMTGKKQIENRTQNYSKHCDDLANGVFHVQWQAFHCRKARSGDAEKWFNKTKDIQGCIYGVYSNFICLFSYCMCFKCVLNVLLAIGYFLHLPRALALKIDPEHTMAEDGWYHYLISNLIKLDKPIPHNGQPVFTIIDFNEINVPENRACIKSIGMNTK